MKDFDDLCLSDKASLLVSDLRVVLNPHFNPPFIIIMLRHNSYGGKIWHWLFANTLFTWNSRVKQILSDLTKLLQIKGTIFPKQILYIIQGEIYTTCIQYIEECHRTEEAKILKTYSKFKRIDSLGKKLYTEAQIDSHEFWSPNI